MKKTLTRVFTVAAVGALLLHVPRVSAQDDAPPPTPPAAAPAAGGPGAGGPGGPGGPGGDFRARMAERIKTQLKASDDEWSVIVPLLEKVETKLRESMAGRFGGMMGGGGPRPRRDDANGGGGGNRPERPQGRGGSPEAQALTETLQNDSASSEEIKTKLAAVREQRKKSAAELSQAREDLKKVLNMRQEASLVAMGILD